MRAFVELIAAVRSARPRSVVELDVRSDIFSGLGDLVFGLGEEGIGLDDVGEWSFHQEAGGTPQQLVLRFPFSFLLNFLPNATQFLFFFLSQC